MDTEETAVEGMVEILALVTVTEVRGNGRGNHR